MGSASCCCGCERSQGSVGFRCKPPHHHPGVLLAAPSVKEGLALQVFHRVLRKALETKDCQKCCVHGRCAGLKKIQSKRLTSVQMKALGSGSQESPTEAASAATAPAPQGAAGLKLEELPLERALEPELLPPQCLGHS